MNQLPRSRRMSPLVALAVVILWTGRAFAEQGQGQAGGDLAAMEKECLEAEAVDQCKKALSICKQVVEAKQKESESRVRDLALAKILSQSLRCNFQLGQYAAAEQDGRQALALRQKWLGSDHLDVATSLNNLAVIFLEQGNAREAETSHRQVLAIRQKQLGTENLDVAASFNNLAMTLMEQGKYDESERLHRKVLTIYQRLLGAGHPRIANSLHNLANVLGYQGKYAEEEELHRQALTIRKRLLGAEHPHIAESLGNLALALAEQGKYFEAEDLHRQSLLMLQKLVGIEHPHVATALANLAGVLGEQGKYAEAEGLFRESLGLLRKVLGPEHTLIAISLRNLARTLYDQGQYTEAEKLQRQALALLQNALGPDHPQIAANRKLLADVLMHRGNYAAAESFYRQALTLWKQLLGAEHPEFADGLKSFSALLVAEGKWSMAIDPITASARIHESQLRATVSETRMHALLQLLRDEEDIVHHLLLSNDLETKVQKLSLTLSLLHKGRSTDAGANANRLLHRNLLDPAVRKRFDEWLALRQQRETLINNGLGNLQPADYQDRLKELQLQDESLEAQLAQAIPEIRTFQPPAFDKVIPEVTKRLPQSGVLVEVVWMRPFQPSAKDKASRWGAPRFIALLLTSDQRIASVDLGPALEIDQAGLAFTTALKNPASDPKLAAQAMYQKIFAPLLPHLAGKQEVFLSLDGSLHLIPFDALHNGTDYLLGKYRFHYLTSGRDLLRQPSTRSPGSALVLGNPYIGFLETPPPGQPQNLYQRFASLRPLPEAQIEVESIASLLSGKPRVGAQAREELLHEAHAPWILHIATHGVFLDDVEPWRPPNSRGLISNWVRPGAKHGNPSEPEKLPGELSPMNRAALLLADVRQGHRAPSLQTDGLLTAENARLLDLDGTQLATLSACETGQGTTSVGQGVYGLRRAFLVAGVETLVTSLWRIDDAATKELMLLYYGKLLDPKKPGDRLGAMVESMQELRARPGRSHPFYWAPFLVIGQDGPLRRPQGAVLPVR